MPAYSGIPYFSTKDFIFNIRLTNIAQFGTGFDFYFTISILELLQSAHRHAAHRVYSVAVLKGRIAPDP